MGAGDPSAKIMAKRIGRAGVGAGAHRRAMPGRRTEAGYRQESAEGCASPPSREGRLTRYWKVLEHADPASVRISDDPPGGDCQR